MEPPIRVVVERSIDWPAVLSAWAAFGAVLIASFGLYLQHRRSRLQVGLSNMWSLIERWDQPEMRRVRARTATELLNDWDSRSYLSGGGADIVNLFELVAYLVVRSKTLDLKDAWTNFSGWAESWWYVYLPAIQSEQAEDHTIFEDYKTLMDQFAEHAEKRGIKSEEPSDRDLREFLRGEVALVERLRYREPSRGMPKWLADLVRSFAGEEEGD